MVQTLREPIQQFLKKLSLELSDDPQIPLLGIQPKRMKCRILNRCVYTHVHSNITHNSQKMEATQMSIDRQMDKQSVVHIYSGI